MHYTECLWGIVVYIAAVEVGTLRFEGVVETVVGELVYIVVVVVVVVFGWNRRVCRVGRAL